MEKQIHDLIEKAYAAFNARDVEAALTTMHPHVHWPKAFEGGYVIGHDEIRNYWKRQWTDINPAVEPVGFNERPNDTLEVSVHQKVKDLEDKTLFDRMVTHVYSFEDGLIRKLDVEVG